MDRRSKIALYTIGIVIVLMMIAEVTKPKALNWRDSYSAADKIPLGCYVLFNELNMQNDSILVSTQTVYEYLKTIDSTKKTSLIFINDHLGFDEQESTSLLNYVARGNSVLMSSAYVYGKVLDTLNVEIQREYSSLYKKEATNTFTSPGLKNYSKHFDDVIENSYFSSIDTLKTTVLGTMTLKDEDGNDFMHTNFIKIPFGEHNGHFFIHTNPFAFSNYHLLNDKEDYAATVLSYLPEQNLIWDNYYKSGRRIVKSPLRYILSNNALKWAFYLSLVALILFVIFKGKRTQRIIPVITPLKNETVAFTQTIGDLYYQHRDFTNIILKKVQYFMEYIRTNYYLNTNELNQEFIKKLSIKSNNTLEDTRSLIDFILYLRSKTTHTENDLIDLNKRIETFTKNNL